MTEKLPLPPHPLQNRDLYTPVTTDMMDLLYRMRLREGSWRGVARLLGLRVQPMKGCRELRKLRAGKVKAISMTVLDRMLTHAGIGLTVSDYQWFTAEDLVKLGVWGKTMDFMQIFPGKYEERSDEAA